MSGRGRERDRERARARERQRERERESVRVRLRIQCKLSQLHNVRLQIEMLFVNKQRAEHSRDVGD